MDGDLALSVYVKKAPTPDWLMSFVLAVVVAVMFALQLLRSKRRIAALSYECDNTREVLLEEIRLKNVSDSKAVRLHNESLKLTAELETLTAELETLRTNLPHEIQVGFVQHLSDEHPISENELLLVRQKKQQLISKTKSKEDGPLYSKRNAQISGSHQVEELMTNTRHYKKLQMPFLGQKTEEVLMKQGIYSNTMLMSRFHALGLHSKNKDDHYDLFYSYLATYGVNGATRPTIVYFVAYYMNTYGEQEQAV